MLLKVNKLETKIVLIFGIYFFFELLFLPQIFFFKDTKNKSS